MKKLRDLTYKDMDSPRYKRARRFTDSVLHLMQDFLPRDRECLRRMEDYVLEIAYETNSQIISVPPELDELDKLQLERRMVEMHPVIIAANDPLKINQ